MKLTSKPSLELGSFSFSPRWVLLSILLGAFALRVVRLNFQPLWWDEGYSLFFATRDFATMLDRTALDIHPPLYYVLLQIWMLFAGKSDVAVRFFSVGAGIASVALLYTLARRLSNQTIALLAAFLMASAPIHVYYSQEVRMYELVTLWCIASVYFFVRLLDSPTRALWAAYIFASAAALYTQYYAAFVLVFQGAFVLIMPARKRLYALRNLLAAWAAIALVFLPWSLYTASRLLAYVTFKVSHEAYPVLDPISFLTQHLVAFSIGHLAGLPALAWASVLFVLLSALGMYALSRTPQVLARNSFSPTPMLLVPLYLFVPLALGYLVNLFYPFHPIRYERLILLASPAFFILIACGISNLRRNLLTILAIVCVTVVSGLSLVDFYTVPRYPDDDYRPLIAQIQALAQPGDNFLAIYPWQIGYLESYYAGAPLDVVETPNDDWMNNPVRLQDGIDTLTRASPRVWLPALQTLGHILEDFVDGHFRGKGYTVLDNWYGTSRLELFYAAPDPPRIARDLVFENGALFSNWGVSTDPVTSGRGIIRFWYWGQNQPARLRTSLRLVDAKGNTWAQDDREIQNRIQNIGFAIPAGTPPGAYDLQLALYRENEPPTRPLSLTSVKVTADPEPNLASIPYRTSIDFVNGMRLSGYDTASEAARPGETVGVSFFWQALHRQSADSLVSIQLRDAFGNIRLDTNEAISFGVYNSSLWLVNELVRDPRSITLGGDLSGGNYSLNVSLIDPISQARIKTTDGRESIELTTVQVRERPHYFGAPHPSHQTDARFDELARLVGYDSVRSGQTLRVVLYWQALARSETLYKVFVHVLDATGELRGQRDQVPGAGEFPTTTWVKNEYLVDSYEILIPSGLSDYQVQVGLYDPTTGARLLVLNASGNQIGDNITLK
jgi:4-amino-4-deoxy-L-arabinose transferase-like glycosyltransferase